MQKPKEAWDMEGDLTLLPCVPEAIDAARGNLYRPPLVRIVAQGTTLTRFAVLAGACPLKVVLRMGYRPVRLLLRQGALGARATPDELIVEVSGLTAPSDELEEDAEAIQSPR